jgi:hypothetical protein
VPSCWVCQGSQDPHPEDQSQGLGGWCRATAGQGLGESPSQQGSNLCHLSKRDQELLRHCILLRTAEESTKVKAREFEEFQTVKDLKI